MPKALHVVIVLMFLSMIGFNAQGQTKKYVDGYVVTMESDTIRGRIALKKKKYPYFRKVTIVPNKKKKARTYYAFQVKGYKMGEETYIAEKYSRSNKAYELGKQLCFMKVVFSGRTGTVLYRFDYIMTELVSVLHDIKRNVIYTDLYVKKNGDEYPTRVNSLNAAVILFPDDPDVRRVATKRLNNVKLRK